MFRLWIEFVALYVGVPVLLATFMNGRPFLPFLWIVALICVAVLLRDRSFNRRRFFSLRKHWRHVGGVLLRCTIIAGLALAAVLLLQPRELFNFPRRHPAFWALVMVMYPIVSVYPQGIIYRGLFFHRYARLFPSPLTRIVAAAAVFSLGHLMFLSPWTLVFTFVGGLLFARTYVRTESLLVSSLEHGLCGDIMFTVGLGFLFYHGAVR